MREDGSPSSDTSVRTDGAVEPTTDSQNLSDSLLDLSVYLLDCRGAIASAFVATLRDDDTDATALDGDLSTEAIRESVETFIERLADDYSEVDTESRRQFGRECAEAGIPLPDLLAAYDTYTEHVEDRLLDDVETRRSGGVQSAWEHVESGVRRLRCLDRAVTVASRAVAEGYLEESVGIDRDRLTEEVERLEREQLAPVEASASVVERASDEVCEHVETQTTKTEQVSESVSEMSATVEEIASSAGEVESVTVDAKRRAEEGRDAAGDAIDHMEDVEESATTVRADIETLEGRIDEIDEVVDVIDDIADQTNILALNASIEAARADQEGAGFGVVADEVKSLAEQSHDRAAEIDSMITDVQSVTEQTVTNLQETTDQILTGVEQVERTMGELDEIVDAIADAASGVSEIADATDDQAQRAESVAASVDEIAERATDVQTEIDRIADANGEQATKLRDLSAAITDLETIDVAASR